MVELRPSKGSIILQQFVSKRDLAMKRVRVTKNRGVLRWNSFPVSCENPSVLGPDSKSNADETSKDYHHSSLIRTYIHSMKALIDYGIFTWNLESIPNLFEIVANAIKIWEFVGCNVFNATM